MYLCISPLPPAFPLLFSARIVTLGQSISNTHRRKKSKEKEGNVQGDGTSQRYYVSQFRNVDRTQITDSMLHLIKV